MSIEFTDEQQLLRDSMVDLMASEDWEPYFRECDEKNEYPDRFYRAVRSTGLLDVLIPEEQGGLGGDFKTFLAGWESLLEHGGDGSPIWVAELSHQVLRDGTPEQRETIRKVLDEAETVPLCSAFTEPSGGSDLGSFSTTYRRENGKVYINGNKTFITDAREAQYAILLTRDAETGEKNTMWLCPLDREKPGLQINPFHGKLGLRTNSCCELFFDDYEIDESDMLGVEGEAFESLKQDFNIERLMQPVYHYGFALCSYNEAAKYANERKAFGQAIGRFELIQLKLTEMASNLAAMRALLYQTADNFDNDTLGASEAGICKYFCQRAAFNTIDEAMQIMGGVGIVEAPRISRYWRNVRCDKIAGGTTEMIVTAVGRAELKRFR